MRVSHYEKLPNEESSKKIKEKIDKLTIIELYNYTISSSTSI